MGRPADNVVLKQLDGETLRTSRLEDLLVMAND